jgi:hypothetical protein
VRADLTLVRGDLTVAVDAIRLSRRTLRTIKGNLFRAFAYNAAGGSGLLNPMIAGGGDACRRCSWSPTACACAASGPGLPPVITRTVRSLGGRHRNDRGAALVDVGQVVRCRGRNGDR